ncbi:MAG TPA: DNA polymerase III subunit alpha [Bacteroidetes bacterium]|nr:DNA polymerase III subunit alpha [Bacteroidota bacterium]
MGAFTHLHLHTQYSILDGLCRISDLVIKAKEDGMTAMAVTDHGNLFGAKDFHDQCTIAGIKPIIGCEMYVAANSRFERKGKDDRSGYHLILLAKNKKGYKNLIRLVSLAWLEGFYYKPRIDRELLEKYHEGLIVSTACLGGEVPQAVLRDGLEKAEEVIKWYKGLFGEDFYLEMQRHRTGDPKIDEDVYERQQEVNEAFLKLSEKLNVKILATNDVHFTNEEDAEAHDHLICINTGKDLDDPSRMRYTGQEWFKTSGEMQEIFSDVPEVFENIQEVVDKIEAYELNQPPIMPRFPLPDGFTDDNEFLKYLTYEGARKRYGEITGKLKERIDYELSVIRNMGFPGYFLIVQDFLNAARNMGVSVGPGRGSAAGSVVAYCIGITDIDPIHYNLLFERFLNPERISMPDIDIDFDEEGRDKVLKYVVEKYGKNRVAHIITFGTMAAKMAIRDVARVEKLPLSEADHLAKLVPESPGYTLKKAFEEVPELKNARRSENPLIVRTLKFAEVLEGAIRHRGLHACGIIISRDDLIEHIPVCTSKDTDLLVTQFDGSFVESAGMLKMDFLGLKNLSIIQDALKIIKETRGEEVDINHIPLDDQKTYELYAKGETTGIFQFESEGMRKFLKELKPNRFEDLIAMNALYRPGPMDYLPQFIARKHGKEKIFYDLPVMEKYLKETYGITVYQEQVMLLSQELAGFSGGQADSLRKAMGKKKQKEMDKLREKFIEGAKERGYDTKVVLKIWHDWEAFAKYAFNKSHATSYAYLSYQTAYLKAHYSSEYMAAVLSRNIDDIKKITKLINEVKRMGLLVLGPDVNESDVMFTVNKKGNIRFGLKGIKGVGENAAITIIEERGKNGPYKDIFDFVSRLNLFAVNKKNIEALAIAGAFDSIDTIKRSQYLAKVNNEISFIDQLIRYGNRVQQEKNATQQTLFGDSIQMQIQKPDVPHAEDWSKLEKLSREKELIGIYLSAHPLDDYQLEIEQFCNASISELEELDKMLGREITIAGIVTAVNKGISKTGKPYGSIVLHDYSGSRKFMMFSNDYVDYSKYFNVGYSLMVKGKVQKNRYRNDEPEFRITSMQLLSEVREKLIHSVKILVPLSEINANWINEIQKIIKTNGNIILKFSVYSPEDRVSVDLFSKSIRVNLNNEFIDFIRAQELVEMKIN